MRTAGIQFSHRPFSVILKMFKKLYINYLATGKKSISLAKKIIHYKHIFFSLLRCGQK